jgi:hypothetical protein
MVLGTSEGMKSAHQPSCSVQLSLNLQRNTLRDAEDDHRTTSVQFLKRHTRRRKQSPACAFSCFIDWLDLRSRRSMQQFSTAKGRKKEVERFTAMHGLWTLALPVPFCMVLLLLMFVGVLHLDAF